MDISNRYSTLKQKLYPLGFRQDALELANNTFALLISYVLSYWMITTVSLAFVGHLGQNELNGCALATTTYYLIADPILFGLNYGCETLLPQCYGGNKRKMGVVLQRGMIIATYACFIIWAIMLNAKYVLKWIQPDPNVFAITDKVLQLYVLAVPFNALQLMLGIYIATTGRTREFIYPNIVGNVVNVLSHYICIYHLHLGFRAAPVSITIANISIVITATLFIRFSSIYEETWHPISRACLQEWSIYLKLAIPGIMVTMIEWWAVETSVFFAARLGAHSLSAQIIVQQIAILLYLIMLSNGTASNILIGQYLGENKFMEAINAKNITYTLTIIVIICSSSVVLLFHHWIPYLFSIEKKVLPLARHGLLLIAAVNIFDGLFVVQASIIKACGMQKYTVIFAFIGFYLVGLPLSYVFTFIVPLDIYGFWLGIMSGEIIIDILFFILIWRFDWNMLSKEASARTRLPSVISMRSRANSSSSINTNEHIQLLPYKSHLKNDALSGENAAASIQSDKEEKISDEKRESEPLSYESITIKLLVFIVFFCIFLISCIHNFE